MKRILFNLDEKEDGSAMITVLANCSICRCMLEAVIEICESTIEAYPECEDAVVSTKQVQ